MEWDSTLFFPDAPRRRGASFQRVENSKERKEKNPLRSVIEVKKFFRLTLIDAKCWPVVIIILSKFLPFHAEVFSGFLSSLPVRKKKRKPSPQKIPQRIIAT